MPLLLPTCPARRLPCRQDKLLEGRSITIKKGSFRGMRGRVISATATHVRLELEAQMKTVTVDRWGGWCVRVRMHEPGCCWMEVDGQVGVQTCWRRLHRFTAWLAGWLAAPSSSLKRR